MTDYDSDSDSEDLKCISCNADTDIYNSLGCDNCKYSTCSNCLDKMRTYYIRCNSKGCYYCRRGHCYNNRSETRCEVCADTEFIEKVEQQERQDELEFEHMIWLKETEDERKQELIDALDEYGLELRSDSKLCEKYIKLLDSDLDYVVRRMCEMKYLYEYCNMKKELKEVEREHIQTLNAGYVPDMSVFQEAEDNILRRIGDYPEEWPWIEYEE